jgi:hypothetical protein
MCNKDAVGDPKKRRGSNFVSQREGSAACILPSRPRLGAARVAIPWTKVQGSSLPSQPRFKLAARCRENIALMRRPNFRAFRVFRG